MWGLHLDLISHQETTTVTKKKSEFGIAVAGTSAVPQTQG